MENIEKFSSTAVDDMLHYPLHQWCKVFFTTESCCDVVDNNMAETFNGWIMDARFKPIITMLDDIRKQVISRIAKKKSSVQTWISGISPRALEKLEKNKVLSYQWYNEFNGEDGFEISNIYNAANTHTVHLGNRTCTCREWDLTGIPCQHALCAILGLDKDPETFVAHWYHKATYMEAYSHVLQPMRGRDIWDKTGLEAILPPAFRKLPGRPKTKRRADKDEVKKVGKLARVGLQMTCKLCKRTGHNIRGCPNRNKDSQVYDSKSNHIFTC